MRNQLGPNLSIEEEPEKLERWFCTWAVQYGELLYARGTGFVKIFGTVHNGLYICSRAACRSCLSGSWSQTFQQLHQIAYQGRA